MIYLLRTSQFNEGYIHKYVRDKRLLLKVAVEYFQDIYHYPGPVVPSFNIQENEIFVVAPEDDWSKRFYVVEVQEFAEQKVELDDIQGAGEPGNAS